MFTGEKGLSLLDPANFARFKSAADGDTWITLNNGQHLMLDKENYTLVQYRDESGKKLDKPRIFKFKNADDAQNMRTKLLKVGRLKERDFSLWAPATAK